MALSGFYIDYSHCYDVVQQRDVAIKKLTNIFDKPIIAKRALREIKLLHHFYGHENITCILDMEILNPLSFKEIYISQELMEADLHQIIRSGQELTDQHFQYFVYQILRGLKYIHSANVSVLTTGNILVNADCELKICDFGLARGVVQEVDNEYMTEYVATRWYRAPEIMLSHQTYSKAIDLWSVGCILGELLKRAPLFKGKDYVDQLNKILAVLGTPSDNAQNYVKSLPKYNKVPWAHVIPEAHQDALDLLESLLKFNPHERIDVDQALKHPYLQDYYDGQEPVHPDLFDFSFEVVESMEDMKIMIAHEVAHLKKRNQQDIALREQ
ncbi:kinase-like domain-containing protein [Gorgonomyces haynaldii]|nr:kinase-like domain-containing protein [Gorgonomyces haynaldii]